MSTAAPHNADLAVKRPRDGILLVCLRGTWQLESRFRSSAAVEREVDGEAVAGKTVSTDVPLDAVTVNSVASEPLASRSAGDPVTDKMLDAMSHSTRP